MKSVSIVFHLFVSLSLGFGGEEIWWSKPKIIPLLLESHWFQERDLSRDDLVFVSVDYFATPQGHSIHHESAERVWWIQETPIVLLGSTGIPLPPEVTQRATCYVRLNIDDEVLVGSPYPLLPQKQSLTVGNSPNEIGKTLASALEGVDASYLSQVANFLGNNLAEINIVASNVTADTYAVDAYGLVINSSGEWMGKPTTPWFQLGADVYYYGGNVGIGTSNPDALLEVTGEILASSFRYAEAKTGYLMLGPADFLSRDGDSYHCDYGSVLYGEHGSSTWFFANAHLPNDAVITQVTATVHDSSTSNLVIAISRTTIGGVYDHDSASMYTMGTSPGNQLWYFTLEPGNTTIDNAAYLYTVCVLPTDGNWDSTNLILLNVHITYTIEKVQ